MTLDSLSLIVCTVDRYVELNRLFLSLTKQHFTEFEVILVDQNEPGYLDPIINSFCKKFRISHVRSQRGVSRARNLGMRYARYEILAFPDDDCWYREQTLETVSRLLGINRDLDIIAGRTVDSTGRPSVFDSLDYQTPITKYNAFTCVNTNGIFLRRRAIDQVKSFDERLGPGASTPFWCGEDTDFVLRAISSGISARYFPELTVFHDQVEGKGTTKHRRRARLYGAGFGALLRKHKFPGFYIAYRLLRTAYAILSASVTFRPSWTHYKWVWLCAMVRGYVTWPGDN